MIRKILGVFKNLRMRQRMLLVYAIGCFLPLILVSIYMFNSERRSLANIQTENENRKLEEKKGRDRVHYGPRDRTFRKTVF